MFKNCSHIFPFSSVFVPIFLFCYDYQFAIKFSDSMPNDLTLPDRHIRLFCLAVGITTLLLNGFCLFLIVKHRRIFALNIFVITACLQVKSVEVSTIPSLSFPRYSISYSTCTLTSRSFPLSMPSMEEDSASAGSATLMLSRFGCFS